MWSAWFSLVVYNPGDEVNDQGGGDFHQAFCQPWPTKSHATAETYAATWRAQHNFLLRYTRFTTYLSAIDMLILTLSQRIPNYNPNLHTNEGKRALLCQSFKNFLYTFNTLLILLYPYFSGIFSGASMALLVGFLVLLSSIQEYRTVGGHRYMDTVFRVFSTSGLVLLHMYMYGWNVYAWQRVRINYPFIFEFSPGTELRYREVLLVSTAFTSLLLATMIAHIIASTRQAPMGIYTSEFAPLGITLVMTLLLPKIRVFLIFFLFLFPC